MGCSPSSPWSGAERLAAVPGTLALPGRFAARPMPDPLRLGQVLRWIALAFVPSSLMLGVTMYLTTDIAAIPLLWVLPLALYLFTFILTFARRPLFPHSWVVQAFPMAATLLALLMGLFSQTQTRTIFIPVHLACFFLAAMLCHGELVLLPARQRASHGVLPGDVVRRGHGRYLQCPYRSLRVRSCGGVPPGTGSGLPRLAGDSRNHGKSKFLCSGLRSSPLPSVALHWG